jgi:hypothetical protein
LYFILVFKRPRKKNRNEEKRRRRRRKPKISKNVAKSVGLKATRKSENPTTPTWTIYQSSKNLRSSKTICHRRPLRASRPRPRFRLLLNLKFPWLRPQGLSLMSLPLPDSRLT